MLTPPLLAILAHESAQPTVDAFLPRWNALGLKTVCYVPDGHNIRGFGDTRQIGESAYSGRLVFERFYETLRDLHTFSSQNPCEFYIIAEYDTVPLRPALPMLVPGHVSSYFVRACPPHGIRGPDQLCALSPWIMDKWTLARLIDAIGRHKPADPDCPHLGGLLDRWIGEIIATHNIPFHQNPDLMGYPWHPGAHDRIRAMRANWIHGWKTIAEFGELWGYQPCNP